METYLLDWANLLLRWLHLITGIAWIGASFYFVMLDNSLRPPKKPEDAKRGVFGELWAVHGGDGGCGGVRVTSHGARSPGLCLSRRGQRPLLPRQPACPSGRPPACTVR